MKLNDRTVTQSKPALPDGKADAIIFDEDISGFGLRIREGGSRVFIFQYSRDGHTRRMTLGPWPKLSAKAARDLVDKLAARVALGFDPASEKAEERVHKETLGAAVAAYLHAKAGALKPRSYIEAERYLTDYARGLHPRPLAAVSQGEIAELLAKVAEQNGDMSANRLRSNLSAMFTWAARQGKTQLNPVSFTEKRAEQSRDRVLSEAELARIWNATPDSDYGAIVRLLMLTGQRRAEIGGLRWSEIDLETGMLHLPGERTKNGKAHMVPLSKPARAILQSRPRLAGRDHAFGLGEGFSGWSASKSALDASLPKLADWTLHDLRRTAVTGMAELGTAPHIIEAVVNHLSGTKAGIAGVYNRANHYTERREALELWAKHLMGLVAAKAKAGAKARPKPLKAAA